MGLRDEATDGEIVRAVLAGDVERYATLVCRYRDRYARYATRMLGSRDPAADAVQDARGRGFDHLADCREPDRFEGGLFLILRNRVCAERRRRARAGRPAELRAEGEAALRLVRSVDRAPVTLPAAVDARVMATVRRHAASPVRRAWRRLTAPRDVELRLRVRPWTVWAGALAAAAGLALLLVGRPASGPGPGNEARGGTRDSVFVRFVLYAPGARRVAVAGTFNQWDRSAAPLVPAGTSGVWTTTLALPVGQHQYAFVVDGARWALAPAAPAVDDGLRRPNSVVAVTAQGRPRPGRAEGRVATHPGLPCRQESFRVGRGRGPRGRGSGGAGGGGRLRPSYQRGGSAREGAHL